MAYRNDLKSLKETSYGFESHIPYHSLGVETMHTMSDNPEYIYFIKPTCLDRILVKDCNGDYLSIPIPYEMRESIPPSRIKVPDPHHKGEYLYPVYFDNYKEACDEKENKEDWSGFELYPREWF